MKKYIYIAIAALFAFSLVSCNDLLDYPREGSPTQDNYPLTDQQANDAIENSYYGLYERDGMFSREIYWEQGCANDMVWGKTRGFNSLATLSYTGNEGPLIDSYNRIYNRYGLSKPNWVVMTMLNKQAKTELTAVEKRVLGEAYFLRAQYHLLAAYRPGIEDDTGLLSRCEGVFEDFVAFLTDLCKTLTVGKWGEGTKVLCGVLSVGDTLDGQGVACRGMDLPEQEGGREHQYS